MKSLLQTCAVAILTLILTVAVYAGQIQTPAVVPPPPPPPVGGDTTTAIVLMVVSVAYR